MTMREKATAMLADLVEEKDLYGERWAVYYERRIVELNAYIEENLNGSGTGA